MELKEMYNETTDRKLKAEAAAGAVSNRHWGCARRPSPPDRSYPHPTLRDSLMKETASMRDADGGVGDEDRRHRWSSTSCRYSQSVSFAE